MAIVTYYKKLLLILTCSLLIGNAQAYWYTTAFQAVKDNTIITTLACTTAFFGGLAYYLWKQNNRLLTKFNSSMLATQKNYTDFVDKYNGLAQEYNSLLDKALNMQRASQTLVRIHKNNIDTLCTDTSNPLFDYDLDKSDKEILDNYLSERLRVRSPLEFDPAEED